MKIAKWLNHRVFNIRCRRENVTPSSLKLHTLVKGNKAQQILSKAERELKNVRINQCDYTIKRLQQEKDELLTGLKALLPSEDFREIEVISGDLHDAIYTETKARHLNKWNKLKQVKIRSDSHACNVSEEDRKQL